MNARKILYFESSPRKDRSVSTEVAWTFLRAWQRRNPESELDHLDLWNADLPAFDQNMLNAKYAVMRGEETDDEQAAAWSDIELLAARFKSADVYLFSVPMWNFCIPYVLKHYFDLLIQPGITFSFSPETGYSGLVTGKKAVLVYARGGAYSEGSGMEGYDLQTGLLELMLGFIGITDVSRIIAEPTLAPGETAGKALAAAREQAEKIAADI